LNFRGPIMGSLKSPRTTAYRSSIETVAVDCLLFEKIAFCVGILATDRQIYEQMDTTIETLYRIIFRIFFKIDTYVA